MFDSKPTACLAMMDQNIPQTFGVKIRVIFSRCGGRRHSRDPIGGRHRSMPDRGSMYGQMGELAALMRIANC
ncbi:hypothetical protein AB0B25_30885 [Nocardia sp. NPDC049190]|uniref:hypothetical protein n=1 Tax=Nocardia sp. NPDC049190 TaxID=3155650 RepID=UPI0033F4AE26